MINVKNKMKERMLMGTEKEKDENERKVIENEEFHEQ